jgi:hypothetical protein
MKQLTETQQRPPQRISDMRVALDDKEVQAIVVATPEHWHALATVWACQAGKDPAHVHDLHATWLQLLGIDHERLTYRFQGRDYRLTDVHGKPLPKLLA